MEWFTLMLLLALAKDPPAAPVNVNTATIEQLKTLPGVGPATARSIVRYREKNGPFRRVEDLLILKGMSRQRLQKLRPYVKVK
jgi:competence protein ComEA